VRQLLTESIVLALAGGALGLVFSNWSSRLLWVAVESLLAGPFGGGTVLSIDLTPDARVYGYALALSVATGILFGLSPALQFTRPDLTAALKDEGTGLARGWNRSRLRSFLVGGQVAVSMLLLVTTGLLVRGMTRSRVADPGFDVHGLYALTADFGADAGKANERQRRLLEGLRTTAGVAWAATGSVPMTGTWTPPMVVGQERARTLGSNAGDQYLETMGIPLTRGRRFTRAEVERSAPVAVISQGAARRFWPDRDAVGQRFQLDTTFRGTMREFEVVGVAKDVRFANATRLDPGHVYVIARPWEFENILVRVRGDGQRALAAIREEVERTDSDLSASLVLTSVEEGPLQMQKLQVRVLAGFAGVLAGLALLLAGVGVYGVMAYLVSQRTREIGVRMALGAAASHVVRDVVLSGLRPVAVGIGAGMAGAAGISAVLHSTLSFPGAADLLYGVSFYDPATFLGLGGFLLAVAGLASVVPARRAVRVDPVVALRYE
jgi:putative ABC transport system permease protein